MKNLETILKLAGECYREFANKKNIDTERVNSLLKKLKAIGLSAEYVGYKPAAGAAFTVKRMSNSIRINTKSGLGRYNYAPCVEIKL